MLLFLGPALAAGAGIYLIVDGRPAEASILFLAAGVTLIITAALTLPCRYTILDDALSVRCGLICYQIALGDIERFEPTTSLKSGPALSLRRVLIATKRRDYILSPKDRDRFIDELRDAIESQRR